MCQNAHFKKRKPKDDDGNNCEDITIDGWTEKRITSNNGAKVKLEDVYIGKMTIKTVEEHTYLGDTVSNDSSNTKNINAKVAKGRFAVRDVLLILEGIHFGEHIFMH